MFNKIFQIGDKAIIEKIAAGSHCENVFSCKLFHTVKTQRPKAFKGMMI